MRFLHVIRSMRADRGGPAEALRLLSGGYVRAGHSVEIATLDAPGTVTGLSVPVHELGPGRGVYGYSAALRPWLRANAGRFDGVIVDGLWQYHGYAVQREFAGRLPYVVFTHGMLDPWFNRTYPLKRIKKLVYWLLAERSLMQASRAVLFTSEIERDLAPRSFPGSVWNPVVVPFGTPGPPDDAGEERAAFRAAVPAAADEPFLLFAGRLHPKKGCDLLLRAYAEVSKRRALPRLLFAGPDSVGWLAELKALAATLGIQDRVVWAGMLLGPAKWGAFRSAAAMILPSHQENFGIVVAEALACGTPVLISNQVNIFANVLSCGGGLVEADTLEGTIKLLESWADLPADEQQAMGTRGQGCWRRCFDSSQTAGAIVKVFAEPK